MLRDWLAPTPVSDFLQTHLQRVPFARPEAARAAIPLFGWETLDRILASPLPPDLLLVARGQLIDRPAPRSLVEARALMQEGIGFVIRRSERQDPGLAALAQAFARDLPGRVHVQLFVTPGGTHGFGWHYDFEDVFIVQTAGVKDYYFRDNSVARDVPPGPKADFGLFRAERTPIATARLVPGDWLYLPTRWWHIVKCVEDSLSISLGIFPTLPTLPTLPGAGAVNAP